MTLTNRVSSFFLGWLGLSLVGFALTVYFITRANLYSQVDERLKSTLETLSAGAEINEKGVEWEPHERTLPRPQAGEGGVAWLVVAPGGQAIDQAGNRTATNWLLFQAEQAKSDSVYTAQHPIDVSMRVGRLRLEGPTNSTYPTSNPREVTYPSIELLVAESLVPVHSELKRLAAWLAGLTLGLWLFAAVVGRWLCRRTLAPITQMANEARSIGSVGSGERLTVFKTDDELEELGRTFNEALDRQDEAFERQRQFTGAAAHQLRTPLAAMLGQVEVALRRDRDGEEYRATLKTVADEVRHLHGLTESLLFMARADADALVPDVQAIVLADWLNNFLEDWKSNHSGVYVTFSADERANTQVRAHPEFLSQLMSNLLDNAAKYGKHGSPITLRIVFSENEVGIEVEDHGTGIDAKDLPHVFEPFFRTDSARTGGLRGVGLGLAIAKRLASAVSARITVTSIVGQGSRFVVWFPSLADSAREA